MKHLIIALVLSFTASFSMACDKANGAFNQKTGALTKSMASKPAVSTQQIAYSSGKTHQQK